MSESPSGAPATPIRNAAMDMARSVLMAAGAPLLVRGVVTNTDWQAIVGGLTALASAVWSYVAAHPNHANPLAALKALVKTGGQAGPWDRAEQALGAAALPLVETEADKAIHAKAHGLLAGPIDTVANAALKDGAAELTRSLQI